MDPLEMLRAQLAGQSLRSLARKMRVSNPYLSSVLLKKQPPGPKILRYLGLERVKSVTYRPKPPRQKKLPREAVPATEATPMS